LNCCYSKKSSSRETTLLKTFSKLTPQEYRLAKNPSRGKKTNKNHLKGGQKTAKKPYFLPVAAEFITLTAASKAKMYEKPPKPQIWPLHTAAR
jgi:hypothetical protein